MRNLAIVYGRANTGLQAPLVTVESHLSNGLPRFSIVGLAETALKESKDRVRSAIINSGFQFPCHRITVNLAPADLPKEGGRFDLAIAISILAASKQIPTQGLESYEFAGELALTGEIRAVKAMLPFALQTRLTQRKLILAAANCAEASLAKHQVLLPAEHLLQVCQHLTGHALIPNYLNPLVPQHHQYLYDLADVNGQGMARRALEIAAAGSHNLLMVGPPGTGKTLLAKRLLTILPDLDDERAIAIAAVQSISQKGFHAENFGQRPFRSPHHTASHVALVGGGNPPKPGEITLAHQGVLFLDELPEFDRKVIETLREPLESGTITISRAAQQCEFPAQFQLIATMNPCPCGHHNNPYGNCRCTPPQIQRYHHKISGPLLDRIDLHVEVPALDPQIIYQQQQQNESSATVKQRVLLARQQQQQRYEKLNQHYEMKQIKQYCGISAESEKKLAQASQKMNLSARAYHRVLKVARTIADLEQQEKIQWHHIQEALGYRPRV